MDQNKLPVFWCQKVSSQGVPIELDEGESVINITLIALGETAKPGKPVQVQMQWKSDEEDEDTQQTILCVLEKGRVDQVVVDHKLFDTALIKHNGGKDVTVYLNGVQYLDVSNLPDMMDMDDEDEGELTNIKQIPDEKQKKLLNHQNAEDSEEEESEEDEEGEKTPKLIELKAKAEETPKTDGGTQKKSKKKQQQVTENEPKSQQKKEKDTVKKRKADGGADKDDQAAKKKTKEGANGASAGGVEQSVETFKAAIVSFLKTQGGKAQLGDIGTNVKKPKDIPKNMKLRRIILNSLDTFNLDVADGMVTLK